MSSTRKVAGTCFCGDVRFSIDAPESYACFCYCESCQRAAGAPVVPWATFNKASFRVTHGRITWHQSSPGVTRGHCAQCGTCLTYEHSEREGEIDVTLNSLDDPSTIEPRSHIWVEDKPPWFIIGDDLPQYARKVTSD